MLSVDVNFAQINIAMRDIEKYRAILLDNKWIFKRMSDLLRAAFRKEFDTEGRFFGGEKWPPLATSTLIAKKYEGFHEGMLRRTNKYYKALTDKKNSDRRIRIGAKGLRFELRPESFRDDFGLVYPELHETGTDEIPARPVFAILRESDKFRRLLSNALLKDIQKKLAEAV